MRLKNMGRGRNGGGGGGGGGRSLQLTLRRQVELCKSRYSTAEEIVHHLRSNYPNYQRTKYQTLIRLVHEALASTTPTRNNDNDEDDENRRSASRKKRKNVDETEARLQNVEALHINRRMNMQDLSTSSDTASASESSGSDDGATSTSVTSDDAVYGEKLEPAFDLMKTMLRNSYTGRKTAPAAAEDRNVELETSNTDKATITVNVDGGEAKSATGRKQLKGSVRSNRGGGSGVGGGDVMVMGKGGPRFKDLGGMKEILEELMMEVIVPLCNPQLPKHLGVRPITGILLHGPPGCGKTRLAHAIANETALPFHYISATEIVSGVSGIASTF